MRYSYVLLLASAFAKNVYSHGTSELIVHSAWQILEPRIGKQEWIMVGYITFKNKTHAPHLLDELILQWHGQPIDELTGSLFRKKHRLQFMAIEEFCLADSSWDVNTQQLKLQFCTPLKLSSEITMYLTLLVPTTLEPIIKDGYFTLDPRTLPSSFKQRATIPTNRIYPGKH